MPLPSIGADYPEDRRERVPIIQSAIDETLTLVNREFPNSVQARNAAAILTVNCYFLLSNAYKRERLINDNRTYDWKVAALTAAAIMTVRPIRFVRTPLPNEHLLRFANWDCATRASIPLLGLTFARIDPEFIRRFHRATLGPIRLPILSPYLEKFDELIFIAEQQRRLSLDEVDGIIPFANFNNVQLRGKQLVEMENLLNVYFLLKMSGPVFRPEP